MWKRVYSVLVQVLVRCIPSDEDDHDRLYNTTIVLGVYLEVLYAFLPTCDMSALSLLKYLYEGTKERRTWGPDRPAVRESTKQPENVGETRHTPTHLPSIDILHDLLFPGQSSLLSPICVAVLFGEYERDKVDP
jgi:hypothetical protein